jgi:hypothetical protein
MRATLRAMVLSAALLSAPVTAQNARDLNGFWNLDYPDASPDGPETTAMLAKLPPNTVVIDDTGAPEFPEDEYGELKLKPDAFARATAWKPSDEMTLSRVCAAPSIIYAIQGPFPFELHQTDQLIIIKYEYFDQVRIVFMDGREHPPADAPHSKMGHSVGHWDGDELVIDTTHLLPSTITNNGLDHSANIHMVERYRKIGDDTLIATQWFEDAEVLDNNGARVIQWKKQPGQYVLPYDCDPSFALEYQQLGDGD